MAAPTFDLWDQAVLTDLVNRPITLQFEEQPYLGETLAPINSIQSRVAKVRIYESKAFGVGQYKAPDASPPLTKFDQVFREELMELVLLEEMERISGEDWIKLNSTDELTRKSAGVDLLDRGRMLRLRNERLSEKMRWDAFLNGNITITYPSGATVYVDYGIASDHFVTAGTLWSNTGSADPIANIKTWADKIADDSGYYGLKVHLSSKTWDYVIRNTAIQNLLTGTDRGLKIPTEGDVTALLRDGTEFIIYDNGYRNEGSTSRGRNSLTRYLTENKILITTEYAIEGEKIADTLDGQVLVNSGYNSVAVQQGPQSEVILDPLSKNQYFRQASARVPRILHPECFLTATVW